MKQPNLAERITMIFIEGITIGIFSALRIFISVILHFFSGNIALSNCRPNNVSLSLPGAMNIKHRKSPERVEEADFDNDDLIDPARETESSTSILSCSGKTVFTEAKGSPLFAGLVPNDISILCRYWYSNMFDCIIVL